MDEHEQELRRRAKQLMRKRFRAHRASTPPSGVASRSEAITERLLAHPAIQDAKRVALFWPIQSKKEVDLRALDAALRVREVLLAYPRIDLETGVMTFHELSHPDALVDSELGFLSPPPEAACVETLDVVIVPGLAFDAAGNRIGYGGGFYDQALPRHRPPALAIGVAFDFQLAADVPYSETDVPVDVVITGSRQIDIGTSG